MTRLNCRPKHYSTTKRILKTASIRVRDFFIAMISKESLEKFKRLYKARFKEELSDEETLRKATRLLNLYRAVYIPSTRGETNNENEYDNQRANY